MQQKTKIILVTLVIVISFAAGRYSSNVNETIDKTKTIDKTANIDTSKNSHKVTNSVTITKPDGSTETTTTTTTDNNTDKKEVDSSKTVSNTEVVKKSAPLTNLSVIAAVDFQTKTPVYGGSVSRELIGPVTVGAFGLSNGIVGLSIGLNF